MSRAGRAVAAGRATLRSLPADLGADGPATRRVYERRQDIVALVLVVGWFVAIVQRYVRGAYEGHAYADQGGTIVVTPGDSFLGVPMPGRDIYIVDPAPMDWTRGLFTPSFDPVGQGWNQHLFGDLYQPWRETTQTSPYYSDVPAFFRSVYPPFAHLILRPFTWVSYNVALAAFLILVVLGVGVLSYALLPRTSVSSRLQTTVALTMCSYPLLFLLDRANTEAFALLLAMGGFLLMEHRRPRFVPVLFGLAAAIKIFPVVLGLLLLRRRDFRAAVVAALSGALATLVALLSFGGGLDRNIEGFLHGLGSFLSKAGIDDVFTVRYTSSMVSAARSLYHVGILPGAAIPATSLLSICLALLVIATLLLLSLDLWKQAYLLAVLIAVVPAGAFDYRSIYFLVPLLLALRSKDPVPVWALVGMTLFFVPKNYHVMYADVSVSVIIVPVLAVLLTLAICVPALIAARPKWPLLRGRRAPGTTMAAEAA